MRLVPRLGLATLLAAACAPPKRGAAYPHGEPPLGEARTTGVEEVLGRTVDVRGLLRAYPYEGWRVSVASGRIFFMEIGEEGNALRVADLGEGAPIDPAAAPVLTRLDPNARLPAAVLHARGSKSAWLLGQREVGAPDQLLRVELEGGTLTPLADSGPVLAASLSADGKHLTRLVEGPAGRRCLRLLDTATNSDRELLCDTPALAFTGPGLLLSADGREALFAARSDGDPARHQLVAVDLGAKRPEARLLTDPRVPRGAIDLVGAADDLYVFIADDEGYRNLFTHTRKTKETRQITRFREDVGSAALLDAGIFAVHASPATGASIALVDPRSARILGQQKVSGHAAILGGHGQRVVWLGENVDRPAELTLATVTPASDGGAPGLASGRILGPGAQALAQLLRCDAGPVKIPTFDQDPATGRPRELHALLLRPREAPADPARSLAVIRAWDGGQPRFRPLDHLLCAAGVTVVSPVLRGAPGLGRGFQALGERDLGGGEVLDLFAVGRWSAATLGLEPRQIGLWGEGRGAYEVLRALTEGPGDAAFPFGFGAALGGAFDLTAPPERLPEWARAPFGDPTQPEAKARLDARSPALHLDRLAAPLLLARGANDPTAPLPAPPAGATTPTLTRVIAPGQGAQPTAFAHRLVVYQALLAFLEERARGK